MAFALVRALCSWRGLRYGDEVEVELTPRMVMALAQGRLELVDDPDRYIADDDADLVDALLQPEGEPTEDDAACALMAFSGCTLPEARAAIWAYAAGDDCELRALGLPLAPGDGPVAADVLAGLAALEAES